MLVVSAGTEEYRSIIQAQALKCSEYGYGHAIYDLGNLGLGEPMTVPESDLKPSFKQSLPPATFKASLLMKNINRDDVICWLDGDCLPIRSFEPEGEWDAAVTLRSMPEIGQSRYLNSATAFLNAGVVWIRNQCDGFLSRWLAESIRRRTDQGALNDIVGHGFTADQWKRSMGKTITSTDGFRVKILDAAEWNCWHFPPSVGARILHFKRDRRHLAGEYCQ
jgi:hypothetical protein